MRLVELVSCAGLVEYLEGSILPAVTSTGTENTSVNSTSASSKLYTYLTSGYFVKDRKKAMFS